MIRYNKSTVVIIRSAMEDAYTNCIDYPPEVYDQANHPKTSG
jgi:hypothetical protein